MQQALKSVIYFGRKISYKNTSTYCVLNVFILCGNGALYSTDQLTVIYNLESANIVQVKFYKMNSGTGCQPMTPEGLIISLVLRAPLLPSSKWVYRKNWDCQLIAIWRTLNSELYISCRCLYHSVLHPWIGVICECVYSIAKTRMRFLISQRFLLLCCGNVIGPFWNALQPNT